MIYFVYGKQIHSSIYTVVINSCKILAIEEISHVM